MDIKIAVAQIGEVSEEEIKQTKEKFGEEIHWYYFDKTADIEFEINQLCEHYNLVYLCMDTERLEDDQKENI